MAYRGRGRGRDGGFGSYGIPEPFILFPFFFSESEENDIKRYSDGNKPNSRAKRLPLAHFLKLEDKYFPVELLSGKKKVEYDQSKGFSHQNKDQLKFDILENLERKYK
ncbi:hypothetical protein MKX01_024028, partial [Papaver californicum]